MSIIEIKEDGTITLNILRLVDELPEETKKELVSENGWMSFITDAMGDEIMNGFSRENFNPLTHRLRTILVTSEAMPLVIRQWTEAMIHERENSKQMEDYWRKTYYDLRFFIKEKCHGIETPGLPTHEYNRQIEEFLVKAALVQLDAMICSFPKNPEL